MTLLLGLAGDDDHHVKEAATRALGCYRVYPCLREVCLAVFHSLSIDSNSPSSIVCYMDRASSCWLSTRRVFLLLFEVHL